MNETNSIETLVAGGLENDAPRTKNVTINEFKEMLGEGFDYLMASALIKTLVKIGVATEVGKKTIEGQKGKPSTIYSIPNEVELVFWEDTEEKVIENPAPVETKVESAPQTEVIVSDNPIKAAAESIVKQIIDSTPVAS